MNVGEKRREGVSTIRERFLLSASLSLFPFTPHLHQSSGLSESNGSQAADWGWEQTWRLQQTTKTRQPLWNSDFIQCVSEDRPHLLICRPLRQEEDLISEQTIDSTSTCSISTLCIKKQLACQKGEDAKNWNESWEIFLMEQRQLGQDGKNH